MYYVCQIRNNLLGQMDSFEDLEEAKDCLYAILRENGVKVTDEIRDEVDNDLSYLDDSKEWSVCIGTVG